MTETERHLTIEEYLAQVGLFCGHAFGRQFRRQFADHRGTAELAMLASPSAQEYQAFQRLVEAMTAVERSDPRDLSDEAIQALARRAGVEPALAALFVNGYLLACRKRR